MATVAKKSGPITNRDSSPRVPNNANVEGGLLRECVGTVETSAADDIGSTYRMCQVPSNCRISQVMLYSDDLGTSGDVDIGIYQTTANGGAVVDADHIASAVDVNAAALNGTDVTYESNVYGEEDAEKPLWQALGLSADPCIMYDVVLTATEAIESAGTLTLVVRYVV